MSRSTLFKPSTDGRTRTLAVVCTGAAPDVAQYIALARGLETLGGFRVRLVTHATHAAAGAALSSFSPLKGDLTTVMRSSAFRDAIATGAMLKVAALYKAESDATLVANLPLILAACRDVDGIVCSISVLTECLAIGQKFQRPVILAPLLPYSPSGELPLAHVFPSPAQYAFLNKFTYDLSGTMLWAAMGPTYNKFRTSTLGIGPQPSYELQGVPQVCGFSPTVVPRPSDWGSHIRTTGHWAARPADGTDAAVTAALRTPKLASLVHAAGKGWEQSKRPIVVSFESTPPPDFNALLHALYASATRAGVTGVLIGNEADLANCRDSARIVDLPDVLFEIPGSAVKSRTATSGATGTAHEGFPRVIVVNEAEYSWLFPVASVIVHAGGAGVAQAAMAAGVPSIAFPAVGAEHFWAARISALGVSPPIYFEMREVCARLDECLGVARAPKIVAAANALGRTLREAGDGVALAVSAIRDVLSRPQHRHCGVTCTWEPDETRSACSLCSKPFTLFNRRRHCRSCGRLACTECLTQRCHLPGFPEDAPQIACERCLDHRRAFFAMHVGEAVVPDLPSGVVLPQAGFGPGVTAPVRGVASPTPTHSSASTGSAAPMASASGQSAPPLRSPAGTAPQAAVISPDFGGVDLRVDPFSPLRSPFGGAGNEAIGLDSTPSGATGSSSSHHLAKAFAKIGHAPTAAQAPPPSFL